MFQSTDHATVLGHGLMVMIYGCLRTLDTNMSWGRFNIVLRSWLNCDCLWCFRALDANMHCVEAMVYQILHMLCKEGTYSEVSL